MNDSNPFASTAHTSPGPHPRWTSAQRALGYLLCVAWVNGLVIGYALAANEPRPQLLTLLVAACQSGTILMWYHSDAAERKNGFGMGLAILFLAGLAVPYYLIRSRPKGQRVRALLGFFGFGAVYCVVVGVAVLLSAGVVSVLIRR